MVNLHLIQKPKRTAEGVRGLLHMEWDMKCDKHPAACIDFVDPVEYHLRIAAQFALKPSAIREANVRIDTGLRKCHNFSHHPTMGD